jgi:alpha-glucoside transport system substrate-binding protein
MYGFGNEQESAFQKDLNAFAAKNGFTVKFTKAGSWDTEIRTRIAGGSPPDVGLFPQPGVMCDIASEQGKVLRMTTPLSPRPRRPWSPASSESGTCDGQGLRPAVRGLGQVAPLVRPGRLEGDRPDLPDDHG